MKATSQSPRAQMPAMAILQAVAGTYFHEIGHEHVGGAVLRGCANWRMLIRALRQRRDLPRHHGPLALVQVPAVQVQRDPARYLSVSFSRLAHLETCCWLMPVSSAA